MGRLDDIVPVETNKDTFRVAPGTSEERGTLREIIETHAKDIIDEEPAAQDNTAHEPPSRSRRDEQGRFSAKEREFDEPAITKREKSTKKNIEALQSDGANRIETSNAPATESAPTSAPLLAPQSWAADAYEAWNQTPRRAQEEFVKRENDLRRGMQQATDQATQVQRNFADVDEALSPFRELIDSGRVSRGQIIKNFAWYQQRMDNPETRAQTFAEMAASYGHSLSELEQQAAAQPQEPSYVREIRQQNQQLMQMFQQQGQAAQQNQQQAVLSEIEAFAAATDQSGNALRPHFAHVHDDMIALLPGIKAANRNWNNQQLLQAAYERAVRANPSTWELEAKKLAAPIDPQKIERARRANKMVSGEALGPPTEEAPRDLRAHIMRNAARLGMSS